MNNTLCFLTIYSHIYAGEHLEDNILPVIIYLMLEHLLLHHSPPISFHLKLIRQKCSSRTVFRPEHLC